MRMLSTRTESSRLARFALDQALLVGAFAAAWLVQSRLVPGGSLPSPETAGALYLVAAPLLAIGLWACGLYRMSSEPLWPRLDGLRELLWGALTCMAVAALVSLAAPRLAGLAAEASTAGAAGAAGAAGTAGTAGGFAGRLAGAGVPRGVPFLFFGASFLALALSRRLVAQARGPLASETGSGAARLVVFGMSRRVLRLLAAFQRAPQPSLHVVGVAADAADVPADLAQPLAPADALALIEQGRVDHVLVEAESVGRDRLEEILALADREGISVHITSSLFPSTNLMPSWERVAGVPLLGFVSAELPLSARLVKRAFDVTLAAAGLALWSLPMAAIALAVRAADGGPVFYVQERIGTRGRLFRIYKFRTMRPDAEAASGPTFAVTDDPRCTRIGLFLRRHYLDELPQLVNVLLGQMSLVGPRPERPEFVRDFKQRIERYAHKHWVKPGLTGWAQVNGLRGAETDLQERIDHDLYYIENWSLMLDVRILIRTVFDAYLRAA